MQELRDETLQNDRQGLRTRANYYDMKIKRILNENKESIDLLDVSYVFQCFQYGLNNVVLMALTRSPSERQQQLASFLGDSNPLVLTDFKASEDVVIKILDICRQQIITHIKAKNSRGENLLQILIRLGYGNAIKFLLKNFRCFIYIIV